MKEKNDSFDKIREIISRSKTIVLCGHTNPDGDAIGATLALAASLKEAGKKVRVLLEPYAEKYTVIEGAELIVPLTAVLEEEIDLFISLDCGDLGRLAGILEAFHHGKCTINIDHHQSNTYFAKMNYVDEGASSTSEIIYELIQGHFPMNQGIAAALYAGLVYDTGGFRHTSTAPKTMLAAGELMKFGIPFNKIYNNFFDNRSFIELKLMGKALENARLMFDKKAIFSSVSGAEIAAEGGTSKDVDGVINYLKGVSHTKVACFFYEKSPGEIKASFRSNDGYDVCALAKQFGGGGHVKASGCTFFGKLEDAVATVLAEVEKMV